MAFFFSSSMPTWVWAWLCCPTDTSDHMCQRGICKRVSLSAKLISQILSIRSFRFLSTYHMDVFFDQNGWTFGNILKPMPFSIPNMILQIFGFLQGPLNHDFFGNILEFLRILRFLKKYREKCIKHEPFGKLKKHTVVLGCMQTPKSFR